MPSSLDNIRNITHLLEFLDYLRGRRISFEIKQSRNDSVMVSFTTLFFRVEVDFFSNHIEYSYFVGSELAESDLKILDAIIHEDHGHLMNEGILPATISITDRINFRT